MSRIPPTKVASDPELPSRADVVIIGGGIVGVASALSLAERGVKVALCEKSEIAAEQSSRNWGWTRQMGRDEKELPLIMKSLKLWEGIEQRVGADVGFRKPGAVYLCRNERQLAAYDGWFDVARKYEIDTHVIGAKKLPELLPGIAEGSFTAAVHTAGDGCAEPHLAAPAMAEAARRHGASIMTNCAVRTLESSAGRVSAVVTERGSIACDTVVLAGGAWSRLFGGNLGLNIHQLRVLASTARVEIPESGVAPHMDVGADNFSFRRRTDGGYTIGRRGIAIASITPDSFRLLRAYAPTFVKNFGEVQIRFNSQFFKALRTSKHWVKDEITPFEKVRMLEPKPLSRFNKESVRNAAAAFPAFEHARITHEWSCFMDVTPDAVPLIGPVEKLPGLYLATGFSGHGFGLGPGAGELVADIVSNDSPCVDPSPFSPQRFDR